MAKDREKNPIEKPVCGSEEHISKDILCEHKDSGVPHYDLGLCEACYKDVSCFLLVWAKLIFITRIIAICSYIVDWCSLLNSLEDLMVVWILLHFSVLRGTGWQNHFVRKVATNQVM